MMNRNVVFTVVLLSSAVAADELTLSNTFQNGTVASAGEVNENFLELELESNENDDRISGIEGLVRGDTTHASVVVGETAASLTSEFTCFGDPVPALNTGVGHTALNALYGGIGNTAVGSRALLNLEGAIEETFDINDPTTPEFCVSGGARNTAIGLDALRDATTASSNVAVGSGALAKSNTDLNVAVGSSALANNTSGQWNSAVGASALSGVAEGSKNVAVGYGVLKSAQISNDNTVVGYRAMGGLKTDPGSENVAVGGEALESNESNANTALGWRAMENNLSTEGKNTAVGHQAMTGVDGNTSEATGIGYGVDVEGAQAIAVGALSYSGGVKSIAIGYGARVAQVVQQSIAIGADTEVTENFTVQIGGPNTQMVQFGGSGSEPGAPEANIATLGTLTAGEVTYPNEDGNNGEVLMTDGLGTPNWAPLPQTNGELGENGVEGEFLRANAAGEPVWVTLPPLLGELYCPAGHTIISTGAKEWICSEVPIAAVTVDATPGPAEQSQPELLQRIAQLESALHEQQLAMEVMQRRHESQLARIEALVSNDYLAAR